MNIDKKIYIIYDSNTVELWKDVHKKLSWFSPYPSFPQPIKLTATKKLKTC